MAKAPKNARVRYEEEKTKEKDGYDAPEAFVLEIETPDGWGLVVRANLTRSVKWPDAEKKEFIHWQFIDEMCKLIRAGYYIHREHTPSPPAPAGFFVCNESCTFSRWRRSMARDRVRHQLRKCKNAALFVQDSCKFAAYSPPW